MNLQKTLCLQKLSSFSCLTYASSAPANFIIHTQTKILSVYIILLPQPVGAAVPGTQRHWRDSANSDNSTNSANSKDYENLRIQESKNLRV